MNIIVKPEEGKYSAHAEIGRSIVWTFGHQSKEEAIGALMLKNQEALKITIQIEKVVIKEITKGVYEISKFPAAACSSLLAILEDMGAKAESMFQSGNMVRFILKTSQEGVEKFKFHYKTNFSLEF